MRCAAAIAALALAACTNGTDGTSQAAEGAEKIDCAPAGADAFGADCTAELARDGGDTVVVVRNPDGGFHRFRIVDDGKGLEAADGAEPLDLEFAEGTVTVEIGGDRYVLPASERDYHAAQ